MRTFSLLLCSMPLLMACKRVALTAEEQALSFEDSLTSGAQIGLQPMEVALTLDDGPAPESLPLAKKLRDLEVPVSYFMIGRNIEKLPHVAKEIAELKFTSGSMIGKHATIIANHSWDHKRKNNDIACIACDGTEYANMEIAKTDVLISKYVNQAQKPFFFRAPGGNFFRRNVPEEVKSLEEINKSLSKYIGPFFWDVSGDVESFCLKESAEKCGEYYLAQIQRKGRAHGIIVLAHDIHEKTRTMLLGDGTFPGLIAQMKREGFKFVHLDKYPNALSKFGNVPKNEFGQVVFKVERIAEKQYAFDVKVKGAARIEVFIDRLQHPLFSSVGHSLQGQRVITSGGQRIFIVKGFDTSDKQIAQGSRSIELPN